MGDIFEALLTQVRRRPGLLDKLFFTHPPTRERIETIRDGREDARLHRTWCDDARLPGHVRPPRQDLLLRGRPAALAQVFRSTRRTRTDEGHRPPPVGPKTDEERRKRSRRRSERRDKDCGASDGDEPRKTDEPCRAHPRPRLAVGTAPEPVRVPQAGPTPEPAAGGPPAAAGTDGGVGARRAPPVAGGRGCAVTRRLAAPPVLGALLAVALPPPGRGLCRESVCAAVEQAVGKRPTRARMSSTTIDKSAPRRAQARRPRLGRDLRLAGVLRLNRPNGYDPTTSARSWPRWSPATRPTRMRSTCGSTSCRRRRAATSCRALRREAGRAAGRRRMWARANVEQRLGRDAGETAACPREARRPRRRLPPAAPCELLEVTLAGESHRTTTARPSSCRDALDSHRRADRGPAVEERALRRDAGGNRPATRRPLSQGAATSSAPSGSGATSSR